MTRMPTCGMGWHACPCSAPARLVSCCRTAGSQPDKAFSETPPRPAVKMGLPRAYRQHARELCGMLVECSDESTTDIARELLQALSRIEQENSTESLPTQDHRRLSKAMAYQLRH